KFVVHEFAPEGDTALAAEERHGGGDGEIVGTAFTAVDREEVKRGANGAGDTSVLLFEVQICAAEGAVVGRHCREPIAGEAGGGPDGRRQIEENERLHCCSATFRRARTDPVHAGHHSSQPGSVCSTTKG